MNVFSSVALGEYVLQEVLAALFIFSIFFAIATSAVFGLYLIDCVGRRAMKWSRTRRTHSTPRAENWSNPRTVSAKDA